MRKAAPRPPQAGLSRETSHGEKSPSGLHHRGAGQPGNPEMPDGQAEDPEQGPQGWPKCTNDIKNRAFRFVLRPGQAGGGEEWEGWRPGLFWEREIQVYRASFNFIPHFNTSVKVGSKSLPPTDNQEKPTRDFTSEVGSWCLPVETLMIKQF